MVFRLGVGFSIKMMFLGVCYPEVGSAGSLQVEKDFYFPSHSQILTFDRFDYRSL